ncbi:MAG: thermonuclease family protein [Flavisolibacter sp.]
MLYFDGVYKVLHVVDGDGFVGANIFSNEVIEFRLLGIDAPEIKRCQKLKKDERELHIPGSLLIELGRLSESHLRSIAPAGTVLHIKQESGNMEDKYGRQLCYAYTPAGICINELLITDGYAKPYSEIFCQQLERYQLLNTFARQSSKGLYSMVEKF